MKKTMNQRVQTFLLMLHIPADWGDADERGKKEKMTARIGEILLLWQCSLVAAEAPPPVHFQMQPCLCLG
jgi:hypothetical protein